MTEIQLRPPWPALRANSRNTGWTPVNGPAQGRLRWTFTVEAGNTLSGPPIANSTGTLFLGTGHGLCALTADGRQQWMLETRNAVRVPTLDDSGNLICAVHSEGLLFASPDGQNERMVPHRLDEPASPVVSEGGNIYVGAYQKLYAFNKEGHLLWATSCSGRVRYPPALSPDGMIYVKAQDSYTWDPDEFTECADTFYTLLPNGEIKATQTARGYCIDGDCWGSDCYGDDCTPLCDEDGTPAAGLGKNVVIGSRKVALAGSGPLAMAPTAVLYIGTPQGLVAVNRDGSTRWTMHTGGAVSYPVVDGEGRVYCARHDGTVYAANREGRPLWFWEVPEGEKKIQGLSIGTEQTLYVASSDAVYALGE